MDLLIATNNKGKLVEIQALLGNLPGLRLRTPSDLHLELDVPENGLTYQENAEVKAIVFANHSGLLALADDSGLEVDALDGAPGVFSARFSPLPGATDADRRALLQEKLKESPRPWAARFRCVVALAHPTGQVWYAEGVCPGEILPDERGQHGFGYDPIFFLPELGRTMAELGMDEKNQISHRARAILAVRPTIERLLAQGGVAATPGSGQ